MKPFNFLILHFLHEKKHSPNTMHLVPVVIGNQGPFLNRLISPDSPAIDKSS